MVAESELRIGLAEACRRLYAAGAINAFEGNLSVRLDDGRVLMTPSQQDKAAMAPEMMVALDAEGRVISPGMGKAGEALAASSEAGMHLEVYRLRPDVGAVVHTHAPFACAFACAGLSVTGDVPELYAVFGGEILCCAYGRPGTDAVFAQFRRHFLDEGRDAVLLANHGLVCVGATLEEAVARAETAEKLAQMILCAEVLGGAAPLPEGETEALIAKWRSRRQPQPQAGEPFDTSDGYIRLADDGCAVRYLDQTELPNREIWREARTLPELVRAIKRLEVRGAPALGIFAGYAMAALAAQHPDTEDFPTFTRNLEQDAQALIDSRPTAVNLGWAVRRQLDVLHDARNHGESIAAIKAQLRAESLRVHEEDVRSCTAIAEAGLSLLSPGQGILTHCNAGPLATSKYGTALGPILLGQERGYAFHVFADETRPLLQGARLTAWELTRAGVDATLICDDMAASVMASGRVQAVLVGADRIAANGDTANKIGTLGVAVLAHHFGIPVYVLAPTSTIDLACESGTGIPVEQRSPEEIRSLWYTEPQAPVEAVRENPAFDVTPATLITAIVTERGILRPPYTESLRAACAHA